MRDKIYKTYLRRLKNTEPTIKTEKSVLPCQRLTDSSVQAALLGTCCPRYFTGLQNKIYVWFCTSRLSFWVKPKAGKRMCAQFFLPIDQTADGSIWHQGYWSLQSSIALRFQMQIYLNNNLWQHTNSLTNCRLTHNKQAVSVRVLFYLFIFINIFRYLLIYFCCHQTR